MSRIKKRKYPDLPERSHPDYDRLYKEKNKEILAKKARQRYLAKVAANPNLHKEKYDPVASAEYRKANKQILAERQWSKRGIIDFTYEKYRIELQKQDNKCKICKRELTNPQVDHCHQTGQYRGILCIPCNNGLGIYELNRNNYEKYLNDFKPST